MANNENTDEFNKADGQNSNDILEFDTKKYPISLGFKDFSSEEYS